MAQGVLPVACPLMSFCSIPPGKRKGGAGWLLLGSPVQPFSADVEKGYILQLFYLISPTRTNKRIMIQKALVSGLC